jgi:hypothetical protein
MDISTFIQQRRKRYLAQLLDDFENTVLPHLPETALADVNTFKANVRRKMNALAVDAIEAKQLGEAGQINAFAVERRDHVSPHGRS